MSKVYIVSQNYDYYSKVEKVFSRKELAEEYVENIRYENENCVRLIDLETNKVIKEIDMDYEIIFDELFGDLSYDEINGKPFKIELATKRVDMIDNIKIMVLEVE